MSAGVEVSLRIGQRVRHTDYNGRRVTGIVRGLMVDTEQGLMVDCALDAPIVIPARGDFAETKLYRQYAPAHEFCPFDEREELIREMAEALAALDQWNSGATEDDSAEWLARVLKQARAALAKATGSAS